MRVSTWLASAAVVFALPAIWPGNPVEGPGGPGRIGALELARSIRADAFTLHVLDIRDARAFESLRLPRASRLSPRTGLAAPTGQEWYDAVAELGLPPGGRLVIVGESGKRTRAVWLALRQRGLRTCYLPEVSQAWADAILSPVGRLPMDAKQRTRWEKQVELSLYFGGVPELVENGPVDDPRLRLERARRRGCSL